MIHRRGGPCRLPLHSRPRACGPPIRRRRVVTLYTWATADDADGFTNFRLTYTDLTTDRVLYTYPALGGDPPAGKFFPAMGTAKYAVRASVGSPLLVFATLEGAHATYVHVLDLNLATSAGMFGTTAPYGDGSAATLFQAYAAADDTSTAIMVDVETDTSIGDPNDGIYVDFVVPHGGSSFVPSVCYEQTGTGPGAAIPYEDKQCQAAIVSLEKTAGN